MKTKLTYLSLLLLCLNVCSCAEKTPEEKLKEKAEKAEKDIKKFGEKVKDEVED